MIETTNNRMKRRTQAWLIKVDIVFLQKVFEKKQAIVTQIGMRDYLYVVGSAACMRFGSQLVLSLFGSRPRAPAAVPHG